jgi:hypothetical protein
VDLEVDSNFEGGSPIKWQDHEVETLIAIQGEMEEEFTKSTKKQSMSFCKKTWIWICPIWPLKPNHS